MIPPPHCWYLPNDVPVYEINMGTQDIIKLEIQFFAGRPFEKKKLVSRATAAMLKEGTSRYTAAEIAEIADYYGGSLSTPTGMDTSSILLYCLTRHFEKLLPLVADMLAAPTFPESELEAFIRRNQQRLKIDLTKNDVVAYRIFTELLYGAEHPYGYNSTAETYQQLTREDLIRHFHDNYTSANCIIFLSGKINEEIRRLLKKELSEAILPGSPRTINFGAIPSVPRKVEISLPGSVQRAVRIGRHLFTRHHDDFNGMYVLNTVLGGYFGSRLMTNIREEKGYTYNIYSSHDTMLLGGYFCIGAETGNEFTQLLLREVYHELERLQQEKIGKEELLMVKNYLSGNLLTNIDGPFNVAEVVKTFITEGIDLHHFERLALAIQEITAEELQELARRYFSPEDMWEVVV